MTGRIELGKAMQEGRSVWLDLETLITTRLLIQANSGGGKSWTLRRLLEESHGKIQQIVLDPEGEFASLREKFDYIVAGKGGDVATEPKIAALLAHRLLELRVSAICDLYEMRRMSDRREFVRLFLEALINSPKSLWHPVLVVLDEAHVYCPEGKEAESSDAVIGLCQRGRKRGFCAILATQRLATLSKDAAAQCGNVLIGPTTLDIDCKRAAQALALSPEKQRQMIEQMVRLDPGQFFALGRAISKEMLLVKIGGVQTHHPEVAIGRRAALGPPPPPERVKAMLPRLSDLPKMAAEEATQVATLQTRLREVSAELVAVKRAADRAETSSAIRPASAAEIQQAINSTIRAADTRLKAFERLAVQQLAKAKAALADIARIASAAAGGEIPKMEPLPAPAPIIVPRARMEVKASPAIHRITRVHLPAEGSDGLRAGALRMLRTLAQHYPMVMTRSQLGTLSGFTPSGGTFGTYLGDLRRLGYIELNGGEVRITEEGLGRAGEVPPTPTTTDERLEIWRRALRAGERKMLDVLVEIYPQTMTREELAERTGFEVSGGTFGTYLGVLRRNGLADIRGQEVSASEALFL